jgi:ankyrin repeat protein
LDETYERILKEIKKPNRGHARRVLQCLVVAIRPFRVAELAEVLAVDFDNVEGIPKLNADWRWEDQEQALLIACSSLIAIVEAGDSRVVQFSHFSVKEFLTSSRLATANGAASDYYINWAPAHKTLAQACVGVLLQTQHDVDGHTAEDHPLARYAAQHWTTHTQFEDVSLHLQKGMEYLFDRDKPHFEEWRTLYDIDTYPFDDLATLRLFAVVGKTAAAPLYYAALCGFHDLAERLIIKYPQDVNANGGHYVRPLVAGLAGKHFQTADLLRHNGADSDPWGYENRTPLHSAAFYGDLELVQKLIEYDADISAEDRCRRTPVYNASEGCHSEYRSVIRLLLDYGVDINARTSFSWTPLYVAVDHGTLEAVRLLLERGANPLISDGSTPLHKASYTGRLEVVHLLLEHGADVKVEDKRGRTALQVAEEGRKDEVVKLLLEHKAK